MAHPLAEVQNFSYDTLNKELELNATEKNFQCLLDAYLDDFWQNGATLLPPTQGGMSSNLDNLFKRRYVFRNVIKEVVGRVVGAFYGKPPNWRFQVNGEDIESPEAPPAPVEGEEPPAPEASVIDLTSIDKALGQFFVKQNVAEELGKAFAFRLAFGRGSWRLYIPSKYRRLNAKKAAGTGPNITEGSSQLAGEPGDPTEFVPFASIEEAIAAMRVEFVPPTQGRVLEDGGEMFSLVKYQVRKDWETRDTTNVIEFSFVDDSDRTFIGTIGEQSGISNIGEANLSSAFELAGFTTLGEFKGHPYVNEALYRNNQLVNLALTCAGFSLVDNGFGEMVLTNVELNTRQITGPDGSLIEVPVDIKRGGGAIQNFIGAEIVDEAGAVRRESPGVHFREASQMTAFKDGFDLGYVACLQEAGQLYALISGDATASGESRIQALADFVLRVSPYKSEVDEEGSQLMTVALLWAAQLSAKSLTGHSVVYDSRMFVSSLSTEEKNTVMAMRKAGTISRETERVLLGIDDPALEEELILLEQTTPMAETTTEDLSLRAGLALQLQGLGFSQPLIYKTLGLTDAEIADEAKRAADENARLQEEIRQAQDAQGGFAGA